MIVNLSEKFIDNLYNIRNTDISDSVVYQAKRCLIDYLGVTFAGAQNLNDKINNLLNSFDSGGDSSSVIGLHKKTGVEKAALINGISSHVMELDDGVRFGMVHPGSPIFSALLPVAEKEKVNGKDLILGIITGYEAAVRLAIAIQPSHYNLGYHPTGTCGAIGAALGIAAMLHFSKSQMKDTLSSAVVSASGTLKVLEDESELKPFNVGRAAISGILSAYLASAGFLGPEDPLGGNSGFFSIMADKYDLSHFIKYKINTYAINKVYVKPYASCRHTHPAIEAAIKIKFKPDFHIDNIKSIKIITYKNVLGKHDHTKICGVTSAKMSIPYSVAVALISGKASYEEFSEKYVTDPEIISLTKKIVVCADDELSKLVPEKRAAIVNITTYNENVFSERIDFPKGEPENPLSDNELEDKFISLSSYGNKSNQESQDILNIVWNLETDFPKLFKLL